MILAAVFALALGQTPCPAYTRTKVDDNDPKSHCLYWRENSQLEWRVNDQGNPETTGDTEYAAVEKAIGTWQTEMASCGSLTLQVGARTNSRLADYSKTAADNQNVVLWRFQLCSGMVGASDGCWKDDNCGNQYDCWQHNPGALAITTSNFDPTTGRILDSDVELNTPSFIFTTVDSPTCVKPNYNQGCVATDVQNTLTHEFGHSLGLAHSCQVTSTMYASAVPGELGKRVLDPGSKLFVCETYPKGLPSQDCVIKKFDGKLGPPAGCGCDAATGATWAALALLGLCRARSKR
ncbi:MAG: matrixin [Myxococcaceae bacterium]|nr:matrixin [Myxococcaceae bacterium]